MIPYIDIIAEKEQINSKHTGRPMGPGGPDRPVSPLLPFSPCNRNESVPNQRKAYTKQ